MEIDKIVCLLCALMSFGCALALVRGYLKDRTTLLLWSSLCFVGLALSNSFLFFDLVLYPEMDLWGSFWRALLTAISGSLLLYGLIWELT